MLFALHCFILFFSSLSQVLLPVVKTDFIGAGPLMNEPMYGVGYVVEKIEMGRKIAGSAASEREIQELCGKEIWGGGIGSSGLGLGLGTEPGVGADGGDKGDKGGLLVGQLISDATEGFRLAFLSCPVSLVNTGHLHLFWINHFRSYDR